MSSLFEGEDLSKSLFTQQSQKTLKQAQQAASNLKPTQFTGGGLTSDFSRKGGISLTASPERTGLVQSLADRFLQQAGLTSDLRAKVAPGFSDLRASRLQEIENARRRSIGNLRENLARRRVLGSSFAEDAITRAELEFGQASERVAAETFLQELDLTNQLINQEFNLARSAFTTQLTELNLQADVASKLTSEANDVLKASAGLASELAARSAGINAELAMKQADLDAAASKGAGDLIGTVAGLALAPATGGASLAFSPLLSGAAVGPSGIVG